MHSLLKPFKISFTASYLSFFLSMIHDILGHELMLQSVIRKYTIFISNSMVWKYKG